MTNPEKRGPASEYGSEADPRLENIKKYQAEGGLLSAEDAAYLREAEILGKKAGTEIEEPTPELAELPPDFNGENAEVTVKRTSGELEGGWEVEGPCKGKEGRVVVFSRIHNAEKVLKKEELFKSQPFQKGDAVPVLRSNGKLDVDKWVITGGGNGHFLVEQGVKEKTGEWKMVSKSDLIGAKIAELNWERNRITDSGDTVSADYPILERIDKNLKYWQTKLAVIKQRAKESKAE